MRDRDIKKLQQPDGVTYVTGLGFVEPDETSIGLLELRKHSMAICSAIFMYFLCKELFIMPATNIAGVLGFDVSINKYTGMIMTTPSSAAVVSFFANFGAVIIAMVLVFCLCAREVRLWQTLCRPAYGVTSVAIPMIVAVNIVGTFLANGFNITATKIGVLLPKAQPMVGNKDIQLSITLFATAIILCVIEEMLFRGVILFALRRFGDGFAIIASAMVYALFTDSLLSMVWAFFVGLSLAYFTVRAGSALVAIIGRIAIVAFTFASEIPHIYLESELAFVITSLLSLTVIIIAGGAYLYFVKQDKDAFILKKASGNLSLRRRISGFAGTWIFLLLAAYIIFRAVFSIQIIG